MIKSGTPMTNHYRFAPSPTGRLHDGHLYSAALNAFYAQEFGGHFSIRIENVDFSRCRTEFETEILEHLNSCNLLPDGQILRQSDHFERYCEAAQILHDMGVLYPSYLTRSEVKRHWDQVGLHDAFDPDGGLKHPTIERNTIAEFELIPDCAWRLDVDKLTRILGPQAWEEVAIDEELDRKARTLVSSQLVYSLTLDDGRIEFDPRSYSDIALIRKGPIAAYHLACVLDDAYQGITHIIRGRDLYFQTSLHRLLQVALQLPEPIYSHHALLLDHDGKKLSKSKSNPNAASVKSIQQ